MIAKQILWYSNRREFYEWLVNSEMAISKEELVKNEKKKFLILPPLAEIKSYVELVNYYVCDQMQTIIWSDESTEEGKGPNIQAMPIIINSDKLELEPEAKSAD